MSVNLYDLNSYDYELPPELIAQKPLEPRDSSRLMVVQRKSGEIRHHVFRDLPHILGSQSHLVVNNTQVIRSRLLGRRIIDQKPSGEIEFLMLERRDEPTVWEGIMRSTGKQVPGFQFEIPSNSGGKKLSGEIIRGSKDSPNGTVIARFDHDPLELDVGEMPLPPYIERKPDTTDESTYQTVYASAPGSAAAPTAGLHFTDELFKKLKAGGVSISELTLNVGLGTFRPVKTQDIREHQIHSEIATLKSDVAQRINQAISIGHKVTAVGTTSVRTLESAAAKAHELGQTGVAPFEGRTSLYIYPGYHFRVVDQLITNFHLPKSSLLMLVSAFGGYELMKEVYQIAVREKYRFFSYGDAMLIV